MTLDLPVRIMAFVGMIAAGAFLLGWGVQALARLAFNQQVPRWPLWAVRVLGGVAFGLIAWVWLFGGGVGWGGGGGDSWFGGPGKGKGEQARKKEEGARDKDKGKGTGKKDDREAPATDTLRVEVLGDDALRKITRERGFDASRRYRFSGESELLTLDEVKQAVRRRREKPPTLRHLVIVVYKDSPSRAGAQVKELETWARDLGAPLNVDFSEPDGPAPVH